MYNVHSLNVAVKLYVLANIRIDCTHTTTVWSIEILENKYRSSFSVPTFNEFYHICKRTFFGGRWMNWIFRMIWLKYQRIHDKISKVNLQKIFSWNLHELWIQFRFPWTELSQIIIVYLFLSHLHRVPNAIIIIIVRNSKASIHLTFFNYKKNFRRSSTEWGKIFMN